MKRRTLLGVAGGTVAVASLAGWQRNEITRAVLTGRENEGVELTAAGTDADVCLLTPEQAEGPFFINAPVRRDIREDRDGLALTLEMQVVRADTCRPIEGAVVEIWHCDAAGRYSGYPESLARKPFDTLLFLDGPDANVAPTNAKTYLRGAQRSNADGELGFQTILPGWYEPRAPHIHAKVFVDGNSAATTQLYFPQELLRRTFTEHPAYAPHGESPYTPENDLVLGEHPNARGLLLRPRGKTELTARVRFAIA